MEIPELFNGGISREEEESIFAKAGYNKSNLSIRKGGGQKCRVCGHGKFKHVYDERCHYKTGHCSLKSCKCNMFRLKRQYW